MNEKSCIGYLCVGRKFLRPCLLFHSWNKLSATMTKKRKLSFFGIIDPNIWSNQGNLDIFLAQSFFSFHIFFIFLRNATICVDGVKIISRSFVFLGLLTRTRRQWVWKQKLLSLILWLDWVHFLLCPATLLEVLRI